MSKAKVNFGDLESLNMSTDLLKEVRVVELNLNLRQSEKDKDGNWGPSSANVAVMDHRQLTLRKIAGMHEQGLSYSEGHYYVYASFGGQPAVKKSPNGMIKSMATAAAKSGYLVTINVGCVFNDYIEFTVIRNGHTDDMRLINNPERELEQSGDDIKAPYAVVSVFHKRNLLSRKVTIVRKQEFHAARSQSVAGTWKTYPVPMAQKTALYRAGKELLASLGIADDDDDWAEVRKDLAEHEADHDMSQEAETEAQSEPSNELTPANRDQWALAKARVIKDGGSLDNVLSKVQISKENQELLVKEAKEASESE